MRDTAERSTLGASRRTAFESASSRTAVGAGRPRVLCVDDDPDLLDGLRRVLGLDFDVVTQKDPLAALELMQIERNFDVVISDLKMPRMEGTRFLAHTRRILPTATRLLLTGVPDLPSAIAAINEGAVFRFLTKPCPGDQLLEAVHSAIAERKNALAAPPPASGTRRASPREPGTARPRGTDGQREIERSSRDLAAPPEARAARGARLTATRPASSASTPHDTEGASSVRLLAALTGAAQAALDEGRAADAERVLESALKSLLRDARAGKPAHPEEADLAALLAARLARATRNPSWIDYTFLLFGALRRLLPSDAIDEIQSALNQIRGANTEAFQLYLSVLAFQGRALDSSERCLLKRIQQCRALMAVGA